MAHNVDGKSGDSPNLRCRNYLSKLFVISSGFLSLIPCNYFYKYTKAMTATRSRDTTQWRNYV